MDVSVKVGGMWLQSIAQPGGLEVTWRHGQPWMASWTLNLPAGIQPPEIRAGATVEVHAGGRMWAGELTDPDWDAGEFTADGWCRQGEEVQALTTGYEPAPSAHAAVSAAVTRGALAWTIGAGLTASTPYTPDDVVTIAEKLDEYTDLVADSTGQTHRWTVSNDRILAVVPDPTSPTLFVPPGIVDIGSTTTSQTTRLIARYVTTSGLYAYVTASTGSHGRVVERRLDFAEKKGPMAAGTAQAIVNGIARRLGPETRLTSGIEVTAGQVRDVNGQPVEFSQLGAARHMARLHSTLDPRTGAANLDYVIGDVVWKHADGKAELLPVDLVSEDLETLVAEQGGTVL